jgi:hypothetical protein
MTPFALRSWHLPLALALLALLRLQGLMWDEGRLYHPDEFNLVSAAGKLVFPGGMIPDFHAYNGLALALPKALAVALCGPAPGGACLSLAARLISALCAAGALWLGYRIALRLGGEMAAWLALALIGLSAPLIQWAHFGTTESALILAVLAAWLQGQRYLDGTDGPWRAGLGWALILGLALGEKTSAAVIGVIPLAALALRPGGPGRGGALAVPAAILLALGLFVLTTPAVIFATGDYLEVMRFEGDVVAGRADVFWTWQFEGAVQGLFEARQLWGMAGGTGLVLALYGIGRSLRARDRGAMLGLAFLLVYLAIIVTWHARFARYLAPALPVLLVFAALGGAAIWARLRAGTLRLAFALALAPALLAGLSLAASYRFPDSRIAAAALLEARLQKGDVVLYEPRDVGPTGLAGSETVILPLIEPATPDKPALLAAALSRGDWLVIYSRRHWAVLPRLARFPEICGYYAALARGDLGYEVALDTPRFAPLGRFFDPGLTAEETRVVFDRPEVFVLRRVTRLSQDEILARITAPGQDCRAETLLAALRRPR